MDLIEFLRARLDEDEEAARTAKNGLTAGAESYDGVWTYVATTGGDHKVVDNLGYAVAGEDADPNANPWNTSPHIARHEIADGHAAALHDVVCHLASVYADHPDYREEWRP